MYKRQVPYLVAFLVGIAVFRTSGAMDIIVNGIGYIVGLSGADTEFVGALPTALMKSLSGSGANEMCIRDSCCIQRRSSRSMARFFAKTCNFRIARFTPMLFFQ